MRSSFATLVGLFSVVVALAAMSSTGAAVPASAALILRFDQVVEGEMVLGTPLGTGTMWRNPGPAQAASRTGSVALLTRTRSE